ncbi:MAG: HAMP domain-containing histidine kinase [Anaerolineae bacterium]|nr:HAMP domain-containing histidine kinase [Anaerolineae bacterium]
MRSLRTRLILSHVLPLLIVLPLVGVALIYLLETQVLLANSSNELERQAELVAGVARNYPQIWFDSQQAQAFMAQIVPHVSAKVMFLGTDSVLLASSDSDDAAMIGKTVEVKGFKEVLVTRLSLRVDYGASPGTGAADVLMPVLSPTLQVLGVIRLTDPLSNVYARFPRTRTLIFGTLVGGLIVGIAAGWLFALDLSYPLRRATHAISRMAEGYPLAELPEQGPAEMRLLVRAFNALTTQLQNLEKSRKRLLANLVHELGRPLGALLSATQALVGGAHADSELRTELLEGMEGEVARMQHLLDDLTRLYDQTLGPLELDFQPTPLLTWITRVLSPWREAAHEKGLNWEVQLPPGLPTLALDSDRLAQALGNMVSNAVKYTPSGGEVIISAGVENEQVWIRVKDTGVGIPEEIQGRIFEPFYRGPISRRFPQGMGLGLSIARDLVTAHSGRIEVQSEPGKGSTFTLWLPGKKRET